MKPGERITDSYNLDDIVGEALRQEEATGVVNSLAHMFREDSQILPVSADLQGLANSALYLLGSSVLNVGTPEGFVSEVYENFEKDSMTLESRIVKLHLPEFQDIFDSADIYLISLMANSQVFASSANSRYGVLTSGNGERIFFKVVDDKETNADKPTVGLPQYDWVKHYRLDVLDPQEQFLVVKEFAKAITKLSAQGPRY